MSVSSANFEFLAVHGELLVRLGAQAERYFADDPNTALIKLRQLAHPVFVSLYGNSQEAQAYFLQGGKQTTNLASVNKTTLEALPVPLPPINEQRRIVARTDALQTRSRRARQALDAIPALLDRFRQSVLAAAFRGDLTDREANAAQPRKRGRP